MADFAQGGRKALFLDRDGVINEDKKYVHRIEDFVLLPGVMDAVRLAKERGYTIVVVTNQSGVARGYYGLEDVDVLHSHVRRMFDQAGAAIDAIYVCPHHPDGKVAEFAFSCSCRKPNPGMILNAARDLEIELKKSILVGDNGSDIQAGVAAGVGRTCLITTSHSGGYVGDVVADAKCRSLNEYVRQYCV
jgi:D-glycero-D-manno-heptose 1,7-bisphosphate phosphatase